MIRMVCAGLFLSGGMAAAAEPEPAACYEREPLVAYLAEEFGETRAALDFHERFGLVEVFANRNTGTWTILRVMPLGMSCLVSSGDATPGHGSEPIRRPA